MYNYNYVLQVLINKPAMHSIFLKKKYTSANPRQNELTDQHRLK